MVGAVTGGANGVRAEEIRRSRSDLRCSFCRKSEHAVATIIQGLSVHICDQCVEVCIEVLGRDKEWCRLEIAKLQALLDA